MDELKGLVLTLFIEQKIGECCYEETNRTYCADCTESVFTPEYSGMNSIKHTDTCKVARLMHLVDYK